MAGRSFNYTNHVVVCEMHEGLANRRRNNALGFIIYSLYPVYSEKIYLDCDLDDINLDRDQDDAPVFTGHRTLFNVIDRPDFAIHLISGFKFFRSYSRSGVHTGQNLSPDPDCDLDCDPDNFDSC